MAHRAVSTRIERQMLLLLLWPMTAMPRPQRCENAYKRATLQQSQIANVFIDVGANYGSSLDRAVTTVLKDRLPDASIYLFEPNDEFNQGLTKKLEQLDSRYKELINAAVWNETASRVFFRQSNAPQVSKKTGIYYKAAGSSLFDRRQEILKDGSRYAAAPYETCTIDFVSFLLSHFKRKQHIIIKLDAEGAEFEIIAAILRSPAALQLIDELYIEWHGTKLRRDLCPPRNRAHLCPLEQALLSQLKDQRVNASVWGE